MPVTTCPAILIAAPASGQGKTTVACALARLHTRQGRRVRVFKCGPDFLDPHWLTLASSSPVHQLDLWMTGEADCAQRLHAAARDADLIMRGEGEALYVFGSTKSVRASYFHAWFASNPLAAAHLFLKDDHD